jgi:hypothetical protein
VRPSIPRWRTILRGTLQATGFAVLLGFAFWYFSYTLRGQPDKPVAASWCRQAYRRAAGRADSARADVQRPIVSRNQATIAATCGTLRTWGELRRLR